MQTRDNGTSVSAYRSTKKSHYLVSSDDNDNLVEHLQTNMNAKTWTGKCSNPVVALISIRHAPSSLTFPFLTTWPLPDLRHHPYHFSCISPVSSSIAKTPETLHDGFHRLKVEFVQRIETTVVGQTGCFSISSWPNSGFVHYDFMSDMATFPFKSHTLVQ